ncbi:MULTISPECIES: hypothetical protein [unclassified Variovorax]|uniref:hypothetical protein n=1 Tax=unclassified Variovorax TaxID=663243 RepID=UPI003ECDD8CD
METGKLLAIVEVAQARRFACQAAGCGRTVFRQLYVVVHSEGIIVLGAGCYRKMLGTEVSARPLHGTPDVRRLTERECSLLAENPAQLMAEFDTGHASAFGALSARPSPREATPRARTPRLPIWTRRQFGAQAEKEVEAQYGRSSDLKGWRSLVDLRIRELADRVTASKA